MAFYNERGERIIAILQDDVLISADPAFINFTGNVTVTVEGDGVNVDIGGGGGGSPGGVQYDVQLNDGMGGFAGSNNLNFQGGYLTINGDSGYGQLQWLNSPLTGGYAGSGISGVDDEIIVGALAGDMTFWSSQAMNFSADTGSTNMLRINTDGTIDVGSLASMASQFVIADLNGELSSQALNVDGVTITGDGITTPLTATGGGGGMTIGDPVVGGDPNDILFIDGSGNLAQDDNFNFISGSGQVNRYHGAIGASSGIDPFGFPAVFTIAENVDATAFGFGVGQFMQFSGDSSADGGHLFGEFGNAVSNGTSNWANVAGLFFQGIHAGSGDLTLLEGMHVEAVGNNASGNISQLNGGTFRASNSNAGTVDNIAVIYLISGNGSNVQNTYGLYIEDQSFGLNSNYAIKTNLGLVEFGDTVQIDNLGGGGTQMVTADNDGILSVQAIPGGASFIDNEIPSGTVDGVNTVFTLANIPTTGSQHIYVNGLRQTPTVDYTISADTITFTVAPVISSNLLADYRD